MTHSSIIKMENTIEKVYGFLDTECWEWLGGRDSSGYGNIRHEGRNLGTHRVAYLLLVGPIPEGMRVLHKCDFPACINPEHLFLGTQQDNMDDMRAKGRNDYIFNKGGRNGRASLTEQQVIEIKRQLSFSTNVGLAAKYNVTQMVISHIRHRWTWKNV